jgi:imidazolonepropionase-like amidohydrolase
MGKNTLAFVGGKVINGTGEAPIEDGVVMIDGSAIQAVGGKNDVVIPAGCQTIDISGKSIMPGMFDCHCHIALTTLSIEKRLFTPKTVEVFKTAEIMKRTLRAGFTTIREPGMLNDVGFREAVEMGLIEGPRLVLAGGIGQTGGHFDEYYPRDFELPLFGIEMCDGVPEVQKTARRVLRKGFDFIKVCVTGGVASPADSPEYTEWTIEELKAMVHEASARGKAVMAHAEGTEGIKNAIRSGVWSVEHGSMLDDEAIQMFLDSGTYLVPTISAFETLPENGEAMGLTPVSLAKAEKIRDLHISSFERAAEAGLKLAVGTDAIDDRMHGKNAEELEKMVRYGLTPMEAIVAATKTSAETCRVDGILGTLEPDKLASLLVVDGNPLEDISILQDQARLLMVMKEGSICVNRLKQDKKVNG